MEVFRFIKMVKRNIFLVLVLFGLPIFLKAQMISSDILYLREISEKGISFFIAGDYESALTHISNAIDFSQSLLAKLSNEGERLGENVEVREVDYLPSKSELVTSVRKFTAEAVKYYIVGNINKSAERIMAIQNILKIVQDKCIENINSLKTSITNSNLSYKKNLAGEKEVLKEIEGFNKDIFKPVVVTRYVMITNTLTNKVIEERVVKVKESLLSSIYFQIFLVVAVFLVILITFLLVKFLFMRKRINDLSDIV